MGRGECQTAGILLPGAESRSCHYCLSTNPWEAAAALKKEKKKSAILLFRDWIPATPQYCGMHSS